MEARGSGVHKTLEECNRMASRGARCSRHSGRGRRIEYALIDVTYTHHSMGTKKSSS